MPIHKYSLRRYRKSSPLSLSDVAFLMQLPDLSSLSRWEHGQRTPNSEVLFVYHQLFGVPLESLLDHGKDSMTTTLTERITHLLSDLQSRRSSQKVNSRIAFLENVLNRLNA